PMSRRYGRGPELPARSRLQRTQTNRSPAKRAIEKARTLFEELTRAAPEVFSAYLLGLDGTFAPFLRASERPMAMACLRLVTFLPLRPLFSLPSFISCISVSTCLLAGGLYLRVDFFAGDFFAAAFFAGAFLLAAFFVELFFAEVFFAAFFVVAMGITSHSVGALTTLLALPEVT